MNLTLQCPVHRKSVLQACIDLECQQFPFMCESCLAEQNQTHAKHSSNLKSYQNYLQLTSKQIEDNLSEQQKFKELFRSEATLMKYFNSYDDHIKNIEGFIRTTKDQITSEINEAIETYTKALSLERDSIIDKLDNYLSVYKINFFNVKEVVDALHFFVSKCRYYSNENNLKLKLHTQPSLGSQLKMSLKTLLSVPKADQLRTMLDILNASQMPIKFDSSEYRQSMQDQLNQVKDYFRKKVSVMTITQIEIPEPVFPQLTPKKVPTESDLEDIRTSLSEDNQRERIQAIPAIANIQIMDQRIIEDLSQSPLFNTQKFKIKKKLSLEFIVTAIAIVGPSQVILGLQDGNLKLLELTTSKVSFYPNTYIFHQKPVNNLIVLKQNRGIRLASSSEENYVIIWTLGENFVPYPERKLTGFKQPVARIMDITDGAHLVCQSPTVVTIVNYNDNRALYSFENKVPIIEFLYVSRFSKFASICQNNLVQIYGLKMNSQQGGATLLVNCELEHTIAALQIGNICACIATESNNDIVICYGCSDGSVKLFNVLKNSIISDVQLFNTRIVEMVVLKQKKNFTLAVLAENQKQVKGIQLDGKLGVIEKFGDLLETCARVKSRNIIQPFYRNQNRCALLILKESQKDIGLYELC